VVRVIVVLVVVSPGRVVVVVIGRVAVIVVVVGCGLAPDQWQEHSAETSFGLFEQFEAQAGRADLAVTMLCEKVAQNGEAVALWDLMKEAHLLVFSFRHANTAAGAKARRVSSCMVKQ